MSVEMKNFPLVDVVDGILSYLQYVFGNPDVTPSDYRWNADETISKIRISGPFTIDNAKPMLAPYIVVERTGFNFENRVIDDLKNADNNSFENANYVSIINGNLLITCGSSVSSEATSLASMVSLLMHSDRKIITSTLGFLRSLKPENIGPETPAVKYADVRRYEVLVQYFCSIQQNWEKVETTILPWNKATIQTESEQSFSKNGSVTLGSNLLVDTSKNFGFTLTSNPQFLPQEFSRGWYYIRFKNNPFKQLYKIVEVVDSHTVRLETNYAHDADAPWISSSTSNNVDYDLLWNNVHLRFNIANSN